MEQAKGSSPNGMSEAAPQGASKKPSRLEGVAGILVAGMLWGTTGTTQALAPTGVSSFSLGFARVALALVILLGALSLRGGRGAFRRLRPDVPLLVAGAGMAGFQACFFSAVLRIGVALGTVTAIGSSPIFAGLLGRLLLRERLHPLWVVATALSVGGCALFSLTPGEGRFDPLGILLALVSGACYALFGFGMKRSRSLGSNLEKTISVLLCGVLLLVPLCDLETFRWILRPRGALLALYLGLGTMVIPFLLFGRGLGAVSLGQAYTLALSEPFTAAILGVFLLGERIRGMAAWGFALFLAGLVVTALEAGMRPRREPLEGETS